MHIAQGVYQDSRAGLSRQPDELDFNAPEFDPNLSAV